MEMEESLEGMDIPGLPGESEDTGSGMDIPAMEDSSPPGDTDASRTDKLVHPAASEMPGKSFRVLRGKKVLVEGSDPLLLKRQNTTGAGPERRKEPRSLPSTLLSSRGIDLPIAGSRWPSQDHPAELEVLESERLPLEGLGGGGQGLPHGVRLLAWAHLLGAGAQEYQHPFSPCR